MHTRTMPDGVLKNFLSVCSQIDDLTDQMANGADTSAQIQSLRNQRDKMASKWPWMPTHPGAKPKPHK